MFRSLWVAIVDFVLGCLLPVAVTRSREVLQLLCTSCFRCWSLVVGYWQRRSFDCRTLRLSIYCRRWQSVVGCDRLLVVDCVRTTQLLCSLIADHSLTLATVESAVRHHCCCVFKKAWIDFIVVSSVHAGIMSYALVFATLLSSSPVICAPEHCLRLLTVV